MRGGCAGRGGGGSLSVTAIPIGKSAVPRPSHEYAQNGSNSPSGPGSARRSRCLRRGPGGGAQRVVEDPTRVRPDSMGAVHGSCPSGRTGRTGVQRFRVSFVSCLLDSLRDPPYEASGRAELRSAQHSELAATASTARGSCAGSRFCRRRRRAASGPDDGGDALRRDCAGKDRQAALSARRCPLNHALTRPSAGAQPSRNGHGPGSRRSDARSARGLPGTGPTPEAVPCRN